MVYGCTTSIKSGICLNQNTTMSASQHYEKISLSKQDLSHVYKQFILSTQRKIRHYLPASDNHDPLLIEVENIVIEHLAQVFEMAKSALIVDGHDLGEENIMIKDLLSLQPTEEVVPFDAELNQKLRSVIQQVEKKTTEVTRFRRELPQRAKDAYESIVTNTDYEVTALIKEFTPEDDELQELPSDQEIIPNSEEITNELLESVKNLYSLKTGLSKQKAQLDSLNHTIQFLEESYAKQEREKKLYQ